MFFYNITQNPQHYSHHILDPDYFSYTHTKKELLYPFFKELIIPKNANHVAGIYIEYTYSDIDITKDFHLNKKLSKLVENKIEEYLDMGFANLFMSDSSYYFLIIFNEESDHLAEAFLNLYNDLTKDDHYSIKAGIYYTDININPYDLYNESYKLYKQTFKDNSIVCKKDLLK